MKNKFLQENTGFTLVETLVAISIFSISVLGVLSILASSITDTTYAKDRIIAGYLAQEVIESFRNYRDNVVLFPSNGTDWGDVIALETCTLANPCGFNSTSVFNCGSDPSGINCELYLNNGVYDDNNSVGAYSGFTRKFWVVSTTNPNEVKVVGAISWKQGSGTYNITLSEDLFNWES